MWWIYQSVICELFLGKKSIVWFINVPNCNIFYKNWLHSIFLLKYHRDNSFLLYPHSRDQYSHRFKPKSVWVQRWNTTEEGWKSCFPALLSCSRLHPFSAVNPLARGLNWLGQTFGLAWIFTALLCEKFSSQRQN